MLRILPVVLLIALVVYALIDCVRTPDEDMPVGLPKAIWVILIILFPGIAALAWIVVSRVARANAQQTRAAGRPGLWSSPTPPRQVRRSGPPAPDDDPDFLARLEAERRRAERERRKRRRELGDGRGGNDGKTPGENRPGTTASSSTGTTAPGTSPGGSPARPDDGGPEGGTPHSPDEGTSDGTSPSPGASQG